VLLARAGGAGPNPGEEDVVGPAALLHQLAALVRCLAGRLAQQRARLRVGEADAPGGELAGQPGVVQLRRVAAQREPKAVLPRPLAVAGALVAAEAREDRNHVVEERGCCPGGFSEREGEQAGGR